jgi:hypothetical protein
MFAHFTYDMNVNVDLVNSKISYEAKLDFLKLSINASVTSIIISKMLSAGYSKNVFFLFRLMDSFLKKELMFLL